MNRHFDNKDPEEAWLDDLFRKTLADRREEPRPEVWKGIRRRLLWHEVLRFNFTNIPRGVWMGLTVSLIVTAVAVYLGTSLPGSKEVAVQQESAGSNPILTVRTDAGRDADNTVYHTSSQKKHHGNLTPSHPAVDAPHEKPVREKEYLASAGTVNPDATQPSMPADQGNVPGVASSESMTDPDMAGTLPLENNLNRHGLSFLEPCTFLFPSGTPQVDTMLIIKTLRGTEKFRQKSDRPSSMFSLSLGITPELAFYQGEESYRKMNYWLDGGVTWHFSRFSLSSGLGLGYMLDNGNYNVEYKSSDSVGFYTEVLSYATGTNNQLIYSTRTFTIYDSLNHSDDYRTTDRYTYLRIPLMAGYRLFNSNTLGVTVKAGPAVSFLLATKKGDATVEYENARILRVADETPSRMKTNWQVWGNLLFEIRMHRRISLYLEPSFRYYLTPTANQESVEAKPPWSVGMGLGLQFNLNNK